MTSEICGCIAPCKVGKKRSYLWIMESGVEANASSLCCGDFITKVYFDKAPFAPMCGVKKGIATEDDLNYCCFCINCVW